MIVGVGFVGTDDRAFGQEVQPQLLEDRDVCFRTCGQRELHRLSFTADHQMHPQTVEVAAFARYVAAESLAVLLGRIELLERRMRMLSQTATGKESTT